MAKPHYQFTVLLPVAAGLLLWQRLRDWDWKTARPGKPVIVLVLGTVAVLISVLAAWKWSPWVGVVGYLLNLLVVLYWWGGLAFLRLAGPAWLLLWLALPAPFDIDENLIIRLRQVATTWTSDLLHLAGILHAVEGNVIRLPGKSFFVADACTGIHSFFVLMAAGLFLGLVRQRAVLHLILLAACSLCLVMIENVLRISAVVVAYRRGWDWSEGMSHQILGLVLFTLSLAMLASADQLVAFVLPRESLLARWLDRLLNRPAAGTRTGTSSPTPPVKLGLTAKGFVGGMVVLAGVGLVRFPWPSASQTLAGVSSGKEQQELPELGANCLPETLLGVRRSGFRFERRNVGAPLSDRSQIWEYRDDKLRLAFSLDYPYSGIHKLLLCYQLTGWTVRTTDFVADPPSDSAESEPTPLVEASMDSPLEGNCYVFYSFFNRRGEEGVRLYPIHEPSVRQRIVARIESLFQPVVREEIGYNMDLKGPVYQAQLQVRSTERLTEAQLAQLRQFFVMGREVLRTQCLAALGTTPGGP